MPKALKASFTDCDCANVVPLPRPKGKAPVPSDPLNEDATDPSLADLLARTAVGDRAAFAEVYRQTSPKLFGLALKLVRNRERAEEVLQEAYLQVWRHADRYAPEQGVAMAWLFGIVRFRALDRLRRERRHEENESGLEIEQIADPVVSPLDDLVEAKKRDAIKACLGQLDPRSRNCILLSCFEGYTHAELSTRLDAPLGNVKSWIRRGMLAVRHCLEARGIVEA